MGSFSRSSSAQAKAPCVACCKADKGKDDELAKASAARIAALSGKPMTPPSNAAAGPATSYGGPSGRTNSDCAQQARALAPVVQRFDRYREALPSARAAADMNELGDKPGTEPSTKPCLTRLPVDAAGLNAALGLPDGKIMDDDLRNDDSGFRAAMYRDESTGKLILVPRDTQPDSLEDWKTNTRNGEGQDTPQYDAMRQLTTHLKSSGTDFDIAGYSKGGGLAQEGGLISSLSQIRVFNSAGLPDSALQWTNQSGFDDLIGRTKAFSAEGDFLTFMNNTIDSNQIIANSQFLRQQLEGRGAGVYPIKIKVRNPAMRGLDDEMFDSDKADYLAEMDQSVERMQAVLQGSGKVPGFPAVRAMSRETINDSMGTIVASMGGRSGQPNLAKLAQHRMSVVLDSMESNVAKDRKSLQSFLATCG